MIYKKNHISFKEGKYLLETSNFFYLSNEGVSLIENTAHLGLPVPEKIKEVLSQLHDKEHQKKNS